MPLTPEQLEVRRTGIGGSEISAVLGESRFAAPYDVWLSKTQGWCVPETEDMRRGTFLEDGIARWYAHRYGVVESLEPGTVRHAQAPIALCTPDRVVGTESGRRLLSIKSPRRGGPQWGESGTDQVPPEYLLQLQWEHLVCSSHYPLSSEMHLAALLDGDLVVYHAIADAELQARMLDYARTWWRRHVVEGAEPSMEGSSQVRDWLRARWPKDATPVRAATPREDCLMAELRLAQSEAGKWERATETLEARLKSLIADASGIEGPEGVITWRANVRGVRTFKPKWNTKEQS
jgi:putative phage-type endonuclease